MERNKMGEPEAYENACEKIMEENERMLEIFAEDMAGLKPGTIARHVDNVEFFLNTYLLRTGPNDFASGIECVDDYLGNFFIRKCMWSTPGTIKSTAASIKKFYQCMLKHDMIQKVDYECLCETISENMWKWQIDCEMFNNPDEVNPFCLF